MCSLLTVLAQMQALWLVDPEPRATPGAVVVPQFTCTLCPLVLPRLPARGLTVLSSFPVKADRAERACVDAVLDTLGTVDAWHGQPLLHGSPAPNAAC